ncbi:MAG: PilZ domain-containing protein [Planctomycetota bacterium]
MGTTAEPTTPERRVDPRVPFPCDARIWTSAKVFEARSLDLSLGGARLVVDASDDEIPASSPCMVSYPMGTRRRLELRAVVVHEHDNVLGLRFITLEARKRRELFRTILRSSGVETLLRRELEQFLRSRPT